MTPGDRGIQLLPPPRSIEEQGAYSRMEAAPFRELTLLRSTLQHQPTPVELIRSNRQLAQQAYRLSIGNNSIQIEANSDTGYYYGLQTLKQVALSSEQFLPQLVIVDAPDFERRGVMLDVSRNKVPKLSTLFELIDYFASWKINELQLYIEHAFAYAGHEIVWQDASPLTSEDIKQLDGYCHERFMELVPNLNCFGHMSRWLIHEPYNHLAEQPRGGETDLGFRQEPQGLCPTDPGTIRLAEDLIGQMTACFSSDQVNVGCDETIDLGYGRSKQAVESQGRGNVYLSYLLQVHELCDKRDLRMQFWADIILKYPELLSQIPKDCIALNWGYEAIHPFEEETAILKDADNAFYVCPGTSSWNSIGGRTDNMLGNIWKAAKYGKQHGALGFMNTDWGDFGHIQPLLVSFPGFVFGAACSWNQTDDINLADLLDRYVFQQSGWGQLTLELGRRDQPLGLYVHNQSVLFQLLKEKESFIEGIDGLEINRLQTAKQQTQELQSQYATLAAGAPTDKILMEEADWVLKMLIQACRRGISALNRESNAAVSSHASSLREVHRQLWRRRNRPGGYALSRKFFDAMLEPGP